MKLLYWCIHSRGAVPRSEESSTHSLAKPPHSAMRVVVCCGHSNLREKIFIAVGAVKIPGYWRVARRRGWVGPAQVAIRGQ